MKKKYKTALILYYKFFIVFIVFIIIAGFICAYLSNVTMSSENNNANWASWPSHYTGEFADEIKFDKGTPYITAKGIKNIQKYNLCVQIIDEDGNVKKEYSQKEKMLRHYTPIDIVQLYKTGGNIDGYTMFVGSITYDKQKWTYIIGFPLKISKVTFYLDYNKYSNVKFIMLGIFLFLISCVLVYGMYMNHALIKIRESIKKLASDDYIQGDEKGVYGEVINSLNILDTKLKVCEEERKKDETLREEWIANISHDLKTPLSPIKGYAEILCDEQYDVCLQDIKKYGKVILRNAQNLENIVENLNFTYKLKNGMVPVKKKNGNIVRLLKEVVIDILNNPKYEERNISFNCSEEILNVNFDDTLLRRAFTNLLINSVIHNSDNTKIEVSIKKADEKIYIEIKDNGKGMKDDQVKKMFNRYYRGTNSSENIEGSGLGMSIAKQIIEAHEGKIDVASIVNIGTKISIEFLNNMVK